jgi:hypothetical protein
VHTNSSPETNKFINEHGLLSQWRGYADGGGFAIVFKTEELETILSSECNCFHYDTILIADVVYSDDEEKYKSELSEFLDKISVYQKRMFEQFLQGTKKIPDNMGEVYNAFVSCMTRYKHKGFKEEQEIRIVSVPTVINRNYKEEVGEEYCNSKLEKNREFRDRNGKKTPYIELFKSPSPSKDSLPKDPLPLDLLPIEKIIVGPHKDKESRAAALRVKLRNTDIKVTVSDIPYY